MYPDMPGDLTLPVSMLLYCFTSDPVSLIDILHPLKQCFQRRAIRMVLATVLAALGKSRKRRRWRRVNRYTA
jgi:hypothetical protein